MVLELIQAIKKGNSVLIKVKNKQTKGKIKRKELTTTLLH